MLTLVQSVKQHMYINRLQQISAYHTMIAINHSKESSNLLQSIIHIYNWKISMVELRIVYKNCCWSINLWKKSFHSFNTDKKHPYRLLENLVDFYCTQLYYMVKFYSNTLKVQWKSFNKNLTSTYHKTFDLGKIIFFFCISFLCTSS